MKVVVRDGYGSPEILQLREVEKPSPKENEAPVKVHATAETVGDVKDRSGKPFFVRLTTGLPKPNK